jgi:thiamine-monophosphate kinase
MTDPIHTLSVLSEVQAINAIARGFARHPDQWNRPHEADAELVKLTAIAPDTYLAATVDGIATEITSGFYRDAFTAGWVLVQASLSDLAAVGASPLGLLLAISMPPGYTGVERLNAGIAAALETSGVAVLGGDLNEGPSPMFTACALGLVQGAPIGRMGIQPGDELWVTGPMGAGNALAIVHLLGLPEVLCPEAGYRPQARLSAGAALRGVARAMMDTSDGLMTTLDHLARLNHVGWEVDFNPERLADPRLLAGFKQAGLPGWPLLCGEHGEFELAVALPASAVPALLAAAPEARRVAIALSEPGLRLDLPDGRRIDYDGAFIRNLHAKTGEDWQAYAAQFQAFGAGLGLP